jgi:hypothetical protein
MKPLSLQIVRAGPFQVSVMSGNAGDYIRYKFEQTYPNELCPNVLVYVRGRFVRYNEADPADSVALAPGDTNDKIGDRKAGIWRLTALDDDNLHFCVRESRGIVRPTRRAAKLKASEQHRLARDEVAIVVFGGATINGKSFVAGELVAVTSESALAVAGNKGATLQIFSLP